MTQTLEKPNKVTYQDLVSDAGKPVAKFFSDGTLKALPPLEGSGEVAPTIRFVVSTTTVDLVGDVMSEHAIDQMLQQAIGKIFFVNHSYKIPQDVLGSITNAFKEVVDLVDPITGQPGQYLQLVFDVRVAMSNPVAVKTYELVKEDAVKLGASVTIIVNDSTLNPNGTNLLNDVFFLECSAVGVPCNQASWVQQVSKAFKEFERTQKKQLNEQPVKVAIDTNNQLDTKKSGKLAAKHEVKKLMTSKKFKRQASKNAFDEVLSNNATATCADLCSALCSAIDQMLGHVDAGEIEDPEGTLKELLSDFAEAVTNQVQPALDAMATEDDEDEADEDSDGVADDEEETTSEETDDEEAESAKALALSKVRAFLKFAKPATKKGKVASKDGDDTDVDALVNTGSDDPDNAGGDNQFMQDMHDYAVSMGAGCKGMDGDDMEQMDADQDDDQTVSMSYKGKNAKKAFATLQARVKELETENAEWEAISIEMSKKLKDYLKKPLLPEVQN